MFELDRDIRKLEDNIINHRRWFHQNPEIGFEVFGTRDYILEKLDGYGYKEIEILAKTGIKVTIRGKIGKRTLAFRADMDALAMDEKTDLDFESRNKGFMHACGHDGHMAILLGLAEWLSQNRDDLADNVVLIFQPDEEREGGALPMIEEGLLEDPKVDAIFGLHILPDLPEGKTGTRVGPLMAQTSEVNIELTGKSAHGAMPHKGVDAIVAAAHFITALQSIISRGIDPTESIIISIGKISGGSTRNILAEKVTMECTIRTFSDEVYNKVRIKILDLLEGVKKTYGVGASYQEGIYYPPVFNDKEWTGKVVDILAPEQYIEAHPLMIAEDFSNYQKVVPGVFLFLGSGNEEKGLTHPLHSNLFDFDERILLHGVQLYKNIITRI
ncbi:MAG TPA: M20 family metallopeptidase [Clostridia bacterium]|nr:M20 family metallopeptidase [Clostridia bacterium]